MHPMILWGSRLWGTTPWPAQTPTSLASEAPRALTMEYKRDEGKTHTHKNSWGFSKRYKINAISRVFMNRARCQKHNFKQIDFQLLVRRAPLPDVQQMGAGATERCLNSMLCFIPLPLNDRAVWCMCFKSPCEP